MKELIIYLWYHEPLLTRLHSSPRKLCHNLALHRATRLLGHMLGLLTGSLATVTMQSDALLATMHVAHLSGGTLAVPPGLTSAVIEIGCSDRDTMDDKELDTHFPNR